MTPRYLGDWIVARSILDESSGDIILCAGQATLGRNDDRLRYDEAVSFRVGDRLVQATRTYFYRPAEGVIAATFADGRAFFVASLQPDGSATAIHLCGPDVYAGTLILREQNWETRWDVTGTKALRITTLYTRADSSIG
jgi:hypothetical protein